MNGFRVAIRVGVALVILAVLLSRMDLRALWKVLHAMRWGPFVWGMVWMTGAYGLLALRWKVLLRSTDVRIPFQDLVKLTYLSHFIGYLLPGGVSIDAVRGVYVWRHVEGRRAQMVASIFVDRVVGFWAILALAFGGAWAAGLNRLLLPLGGALVAVTLGWVLAFLPLTGRVIRWGAGRVPFGERLVKLYASLERFSRDPLPLAGALGVSLLFQFFYIMAAHAALTALSPQPPSVGTTLAYVSLINALTMIPITIGGLGIREGGFVAAFAPLVGREVAFAASLLYYALGILAALPGGVLWMLQKDTLRAYHRASSP